MPVLLRSVLPALGRRCRERSAAVASWLAWLGLGLLVRFPAPLESVARLYHALCAPLPALATVGRAVPPRSLGLLLLVVCVVAGVGLAAGAGRLVRSLRFARRLDRLVATEPERLAEVARRLGLEGRLTYLAHATPAAFCYGFARPRVAITAGLVDRLDDDELDAVILHERHHLRRRDPLRYLLLHAVAAGAFMVPLVPALRRRAETRIELAADRAALAVVPRGALAGALAATLGAGPAIPAGAAPLSATEARIAHLAGRPERPPLPLAVGAASLALALLLGAALAALARPEQVRELVCALCPGLA